MTKHFGKDYKEVEQMPLLVNVMKISQVKSTRAQMSIIRMVVLVADMGNLKMYEMLRLSH